MGIAGFLEYIQRSCPQACVRVDLGQLAKKRLESTGRRGKALVGQDPLILLVDANSCLHRLYGGSFTDWVCGGQWNSMFQFIDYLARSSRSNNIKLVVFFNGSLEKGRTQLWFQQQEIDKHNAFQVLNHVYHRCSSPGKSLWFPPVALDSCIRLALRQCGITCISTTHDHTHEIISFLRQTNAHGILTQGAEFAFFDVPMLFSSHRFKLSMKGELSSQEINIEEFAKMLNLHPERFVVMGALMGNHVLTDEDLSSFHWSLLGPDHPLNGMKDRQPSCTLPPMDVIFNALVSYVRDIPNIYDLDAVANDIFKDSPARLEAKIQRFKSSVEYYYSGTKDAWTRHRGKGPKFNFRTKRNKGQQDRRGGGDASHMSHNQNKQNTPGPGGEGSNEVDPDLQKAMADFSLNETGDKQEQSSSNTQTPNRQIIPSLMDQPTPPCLVIKAPPLPLVAREVIRIAQHRHENGLMMSNVYQVLTQGELRLNAGLEDELSGEFPPSTFMFRPIRQRVYGILFSAQHPLPKQPKMIGPGDPTQNLELPQVVIKEWWLRQNGAPQKPDLVEAQCLEWIVPPLQRLWLGREPEDKQTRLKAFLSCLGSDSPSLLKPSFVPRHALVMCCVLRYMYQLRPPILYKHELEAFLAQSVSPILNNTKLLQELQVSSITTRGVQLAALFMRGVEMALFVNDATGSPIPWELCCPWLFFDGKLFQQKLQKALMGSRLRELCDNKPDLTGKAERMMQCITEGTNLKFANPSFSNMMGPGMYPPPGEFFYNLPPGPGLPPGPPRERGIYGKRPVPGPGGQLEVAGMVVGEWAGSDGRRPKKHENLQNRPAFGRGGGGGNLPFEPLPLQYPPPFYHHQQGPGIPPMWGMGYQPAIPPMPGVPQHHPPQQRRYLKQKQYKKRTKPVIQPGQTQQPRGKGRGRGITLQMESPEKQDLDDDEDDENIAQASGGNAAYESSSEDSSSEDEQLQASGYPGEPGQEPQPFPVGEFRISPSDMTTAQADPGQQQNMYEGGYDMPAYQANAQFNGNTANMQMNFPGGNQMTMSLESQHRD